MPQPASTVKWNGNYLFGNEVLIAKPAFGTLVAAVIAGWSTTETHLGRTFATLIGTKQPVTMSMYEAVRSFEIQRDLLRTAANDVLPKRYATIMDVSLSVLTRAASDRNKFAHWVWGASADPELDALFLVEPKHFWKLAVAQIKHSKKGLGMGALNFVATQPRIDREHIYVYRLNDLQQARERVERAFWIADRLRALVEVKKGTRRRVIYGLLCAEPDIQKTLADRKKKVPRSKRPAPPSPSEK
jgi:hypothetical protein